jgi:hypothetical protein
LLTLDSRLGALFDHPTAYPEVIKVFARHNPEFADRMDGQTEVTLREAIVQNPNPERLQAQVEALLATLISEMAR